MSHSENANIAVELGEDGTPGDHRAPVLVYNAVTNEEAEVVRATLSGAGIPAFLNMSTANPVLGAVDDRLGEVWVNGVFVPAAHADAARAVLASPPPTDQEIAAAIEADPLTLEEAEANVRND